MAECALLPVVPSPVSQFFNAVPQWRVGLPVRRVLRCVPANAGRCIPLVQLLRERVRSASVRRFHHPEQRVPVRVQVVRRGVPVNAMFRVV